MEIFKNDTQLLLLRVYIFLWNRPQIRLMAPMEAYKTQHSDNCFIYSKAIPIPRLDATSHLVISGITFTLPP